MITAGQQFAAAVRNDVVHLAFWSATEDGWRLACADEIAQLQGQDPILSCATCIEVADEEVAGDPPLLQDPADLRDFMAAIDVTIEELARVAGVSWDRIQQNAEVSPVGCTRELSTS